MHDALNSDGCNDAHDVCVSAAGREGHAKAALQREGSLFIYIYIYIYIYRDGAGLDRSDMGGGFGPEMGRSRDGRDGL